MRKMRKSFLKRSLTFAMAVIICFTSGISFLQSFVFANESETVSSETASTEIATPSVDTSTEEQAASESETNLQTGQTESAEAATAEEAETVSESEVTYLDYDKQPTTLEEVQAWIDAYIDSNYSLDAKPHWQYEAASSLVPSGWRCSYVEDKNYSGGKYWTVFPTPTSRTPTSGDFDVYDTLAGTFITGFNTLSDAVSYVNGGTVNDAGGASETGDSATPYTIKVKADTTLTEMLSITNTTGVTITTDSSATSAVTITRTNTTALANETRHFKVESSGQLILENIILEGNWNGSTVVTSSTGGGGVWVVGGALVLNTGAEITNCYRSDVSISGVSTGGVGGAVYVDQGTFTMNDGKIYGNFASALGGGVAVKRSYFEMSGGSISGNYARLSGGGVGVASSTFYMCGGSIGDNDTAYSAGGVRVGYDDEAYSDANGTANAAELATLAAARLLHGDTSSFYMTGGTIEDNEATYCGGGVIVRDGAEFYMGSGSYDHTSKVFTPGGSGTPTISGNKAHYAGGGVFVGLFEMKGTATYPTFYEDSAKFYMYDGAVIDANQTEWTTGAYGYWLYGGGVHVNWGCEFEMNGGDIINNIAAYCGGGVSVAGATFTMNGGHISGNSTDTSFNNTSATGLVAYGGGVWIGHAYTMDEDGDGDYTAGASHPAGSTFTMTGGLIGGLAGYLDTASSGSGIYYGNHAEDDGGGVYVGGNSRFIMKGDAQINYNDTENSGGGVYVGSGDYGTDSDSDGIADSSFTMENGYILNNTSLDDGGGVVVAGATFNMSKGYISGNTTTNTDATSGGVYVCQTTNTNGTYYGNFNMTGGVVGGLAGYYSTATPSRVDTQTYYGNYAVSSGGGVYVTDDAAFSMSGSAQVNYNGTDAYGGGVYVTVGEKGTGKTSFTMASGYILNNKSLNDGGGVYLSGVDFTLKDGCYISGNKTTSSANNATSGGLFVEDYNSAGTNYDGILRIAGGLIGGTAKYTGNATAEGTASVAGGALYGNYSRYYGGGVSAVNAEIIMTGGSIANNTGHYQGGGVFLFGSILTMENAEIRENQTLQNYGGGVCMFTTGSTLPTGGAIGSSPAGTVIGASSMTMKDGAVVQGNNGSGFGGGIYNTGTLTMEAGSLVDTNTSAMGGGGIYTPVNGALTMEAGSVVSNNKTTAGNGGGVSIVYGTIDMQAGALITGNTSAAGAGGIYLQAYISPVSPSVTNTIAGDVTNNTAATYGGGIVISGGSTPTSYKITGTISGNTAATYGGGIYYTSTSANTTVTVSGATVTANGATNGGGIYTTGTAVLTVSGATVTANMAGTNGGGIYTASTRALTVSNNTKITNNVALGNGGGIYTTNTAYSNLNVTDTSTTFSGNRAAYATEIDSALVSSYIAYVSASLAAVSVYTYALNNYDINYAAAPSIYTIILDPNGGTFTGSVENLGYLYVAAANIAESLADLGYVIDSNNNITYVSANDTTTNAAAVNASVTTGDFVQSGLSTLTKDGAHVKAWTIGSAAATASINMTSTAYYDSTNTYTSLATTAAYASATAPRIYAQWNTYTITLALDGGITWADLADNMAVTFTNTSNASMTLLFTDPTMNPGNYYTIYPETGALNGIQTLGNTDTWTVTANLPLSGQYYIKEITLDGVTVSGTSVTPGDADSCVIVMTIGKTAIPWGHWIYKSQ